MARRMRRKGKRVTMTLGEIERYLETGIPPAGPVRVPTLDDLAEVTEPGPLGFRVHDHVDDVHWERAGLVPPCKRVVTDPFWEPST